MTAPDDASTSPHLDPDDWEGFRRSAHALLDACVDRLQQAEAYPWIPVPEDVRAGFHLDDADPGRDDLAQALRETVMPYATGNTHPRFFGWVHGTGLAEGLLSELVAATMNSNCGGRDHGMIYVERAVIDWTRRQMGFPETASGVLVTGTSQATVIALAAARHRALGPSVRMHGNKQARLVAYAGGAVHNSTQKALELLGLGRACLRLIPGGPEGVDLAALRARIAADRAGGATPFAIVGTAGSVDFGVFDDLDALADLARDAGLWLHVDGAFGAWTRLAQPPWRSLSDGIERADSIACDFHKWIYVPYDCGIVLIRDAAEHRAPFAERPAYLAGMQSGLAGGEPWFCDYGMDLSRGARALKVWSAVRRHGAIGLGAAITGNCRNAARMGAKVAASAHMALAAPVVSNLVVFTADTRLLAAEQSALNAQISQQLQLDGLAVFSTTTADLAAGPAITCLRAAITNHRTRPEDVDMAIAAVRAARDRLSPVGSPGCGP